MTHRMKIATPQTYEDRIRAIQIYRSARVGPRNYAKLVQKSNSYEDAWESLCQAYTDQKIDHKLLCDFDDAKEELERGDAYGASLLFLNDPSYPKLLKTTEAAPPFIWAKGHLELFDLPQIAIVGARNASLEGARMAQGLARELCENGYCVVSGLARGIDTSAHNGALFAHTVGVIAGGLDIHYPRQNAQLQENIAERGLLISEMPFGHKPQASNFPQRNRIIAGISSATIVIECTRRSGTMITANDANAMGRDVMAVPGHPLNPRSEGPNYLIREGATMVRNIGDILEALGEAIQKNIPPEPDTETEALPPKTDWAKMGIDEIEGRTVRDLNGEVTNISP